MLKATTIKDIREPSAVAFSDLRRRNGCRLSSWPRSSITTNYVAEQTKFPKQRIVGEFFHALLEEIASLDCSNFEHASKSLEIFYYKQLSLYKERYVSQLLEFNEDLDYWPELSDSFSSAKLALEREHAFSGQVLRELERTSKSLGITGVIDEVSISRDELVICDYKSVYNIDGERLEQYKLQLILYALLLEDEFHLKVSGLIRGLGNSEMRIGWTDEEKERTKSLIRNYRNECTLSGLDLQSELRDLTNVSSTNCIDCRLRSGCPVFREVQSSRFGDGYEIGVFRFVPVDGGSVNAQLVGGTVAPGYYNIDGIDFEKPVLEGQTIFLDRLAVTDKTVSLTKHSETRILVP